MDRPSRREALALLYEHHYTELVRLAFGLTGDWGLAEELAQEAFVRVWRSWGTIRDPQSAPAYLRTSVVNLARRSLRRRRLERRAWRRRGAGDLPSADPGESVDLLRALARLPAGKRACVVLRFYLDVSEADTAAALGVSVGTVKSQTAKALRRLVPYQPMFALFDCPRSADGLVTGGADETAQGKQDRATVGVKRHNVGCGRSVVGERR